MSGFDSVDNEDFPERQLTLDLPCPEQWNTDENPPYSYYLYYMWANIITLNQYRY
jgi:AMP deaminase